MIHLNAAVKHALGHSRCSSSLSLHTPADTLFPHQKEKLKQYDILTLWRAIMLQAKTILSQSESRSASLRKPESRFALVAFSFFRVKQKCLLSRFPKRGVSQRVQLHPFRLLRGGCSPVERWASVYAAERLLKAGAPSHRGLPPVLKGQRQVPNSSSSEVVVGGC